MWARRAGIAPWLLSGWLALHGCPEPPGPGGDDDDDTSEADDDTGDDDDITGDDDTTGDDDDLGEARALWVTRWDYGDEDDVETIMDRADDAGFNVVLFQVRGTFDAFYASSLEPWASELSGTLGQDPGWDPLQTALDLGHARGLEVHAWLNTFPFWRGTSPPPETQPRHMFLQHPEWLVVDEWGDPMDLNSSYVFASPGSPEVRAHVAAVASDIVTHYAVDGIHLDYIRYPGPEYSHDDASLAAYADSGGALDYGDWQREQVTATAAAVNDAIGAVDPDVLLTAAVWGIYEDLWSWWTSQGNVDYYQDSLAMVDEGALDVIVPMIYWPLTEPSGEYTDYRTLVEFFASSVPGDALWAGMKADYGDFGEIAAEIDVAREVGAGGVSIFAYSTLVEHDYFDDLAAGPFAGP